jgi:hypothetical protein
MWNIRKYAAIAAVGTGLAVAAAGPASAQCGGWGWGGGYGGWGGGYGAAGWGGYGAAGWGGYGGGYGWGCRAHHHPHSHGGYALAYLPRRHQSGYAYAGYTSLGSMIEWPTQGPAITGSFMRLRTPCAIPRTIQRSATLLL